MGVNYQDSFGISNWEAKIFLEDSLIPFLNSLPFKNTKEYKEILHGKNSIFNYIKIFRNYKNSDIRLVRILEKNNYKITSYETLVFLNLIFIDKKTIERLASTIVSDNPKDTIKIKYNKLKSDYNKRRS